jgi:hypothetical protein
MRWLLLILTSSLFYSVASAQQIDPIEADRPDQTETASTVPKGYVQIEAGVGYEQDGKGIGTLTVPTVLTKYGVTDRFEIRLITEVVSYHFLSERNTGLTPVEVGLKTNLIQESGVVPTISFIGYVSIPEFASKGFKNNYSHPRFRFAFEHTLSDKFSLGYNLGMEWTGGPEANVIFTLTGAYTISDKVGMFLEIYDSDEYPWFDGGLTYLITNDFLLDFSSGIGFNRSYNYFVGIGASVRFK